MPAAGAPPSLTDFLTAYADAVRGARSLPLDARRGSAYDIAGGVSAVLWSRQAQHDRQLFRASYTASATSADLDRIVELKYQTTRVTATYGAGTAVVGRAAAGPSGTLYEGTRIGARSSRRLTLYRIAQDVLVDAAATSFTIPIEATDVGTGVAVRAAGSALKWEDSVFDENIEPLSLVCGDGTDYELDATYLARARADKLARRVGYPTRIVAALEAAGAAEVVILDAGALGTSKDFGLNYCYVGDAGFSTTQALKDACFLALDDVRVAGCDVQVLGMVTTPLTISVAIAMPDDPVKFNVARLGTDATRIVVDRFTSDPAWWTFRSDAIASVIARATGAQSVDVTTDISAPAVAFPDVLPRYVLGPNSLRLTFTGPELATSQPLTHHPI